MSGSLIIVDSQAKADFFKDQVPGDCEVLQVLDLPLKPSWQVPKDKLRAVRPRFDFAPLPSGGPFFEKLRGALDRDIYLALENHLPGEYWSWLINGYLAAFSRGRKTAGRLRLLGFGREEFQHAFRMIDIVHEERALYYQLRLLLNDSLAKHLERLLGTCRGVGDLPLDYATLTILALLREREAGLGAIAPPPEKWQVRVIFSTPEGSFAGRLHYAFGISDDGYFLRAAEARKAIDLFRNESILVGKIEQKQTIIEPPAPYRWPELMEEALLLHNLSPLEVGRALVELYVGLAPGGAGEGLISDYWGLAGVGLAELVDKIKRFLDHGKGNAGPGESKPAPEAGSLLPLRPELGPAELPAELAPATRTIYEMIRARGLAGQMTPAGVETVEIELGAAESCLFSGTLRRVTEAGFLSRYQGIDEKSLLEPSPLSSLREGQPVPVLQIIPEPVCFMAPEQYTISDLAADLDGFGLTAEPLVLQRLGLMFAHGYLDLLPQEGLRLGESARKTAALLERALPSLAGLQLPALMHQLCQEMASGRKPLDFGLLQFEQTLIMQGNVLVKTEAVSSGGRRRSSANIIKAADRGAGLQGVGQLQPPPSPGQEKGVESLEEGGDSAGGRKKLPADLLAEGGGDFGGIPPAAGLEEKKSLGPAAADFQSDNLMEPETLGTFEETGGQQQQTDISQKTKVRRVVRRVGAAAHGGKRKVVVVRRKKK